MSAPHYSDEWITLHHGDCLEVLRTLPDASVDSVVTDPPYGLEFMGKEWDKFGATVETAAEGQDKTHPFRDGTQRVRFGNGLGAMLAFQAWCELWAAECLRVLKPGGHMLAFGGTRTSHRLACAIEDAGFEIRDSIAWLYGSGFPKSLDVSKAIDAYQSTGKSHSRAIRDATDAREVIGNKMHRPGKSAGQRPNSGGFSVDMQEQDGKNRATLEARMGAPLTEGGHRRDLDITAPATPEAERWQGWGTALKPAHEPVVVARKPLIGTVAANVLAHGTGALNVDGCRVEGEPRSTGTINPHAVSGVHGTYGSDNRTDRQQRYDANKPAGRWPANVVLDESQAAVLDEQSGESASASRVGMRSGKDVGVLGAFNGQAEVEMGHDDIGGASRFFLTVPIDNLDARFAYTAKAGSDERPTYTKSGGKFAPAIAASRCGKCGKQNLSGSRCVCPEPEWIPPSSSDTVSHPTVKPLALMRWLVRLVTPPGGTVLEPFAGSGTTAEACLLERFHCIAIEREADYLPLIVQRITRRRDPIAYLTDAGHDLGLFAEDETAS